ncbi:hypothetical protein Tco_1551799 [Tanacetum coccineum]
MRGASCRTEGDRIVDHLSDAHSRAGPADWSGLRCELFHEAWGRYKDLLRACPHHGFTELHQLDTFYNALNPADQDSLNFAAGGNWKWIIKKRTKKRSQNDKTKHGNVKSVKSQSQPRSKLKSQIQSQPRQSQWSKPKP